MSVTVSELGIKVIQDGLAEANDKLKKVGDQATATQTAFDKFQKHTQKSLNDFGASVNKANAAIQGLAGNASRMLTRAMQMLSGAISVGAYVKLADTWSDLTSRVQNAIGPHEKAVDVMSRLSDMARVSYSDLGQTAASFVENAQSLQELGLSTDQQLKYQEALNNALVVSGARADRAAGVQRAFSAALALGALRGDQLNSVLISGSRISKSLAKELGSTTNELRKLGAEGKITRQVMIRAMIKDFEILRGEAEEMPATIGDGFQLIKNAALTLVGTFDKVSTISFAVGKALEKVADAGMWLSKHLEVLNGILAAFATIVVARVLPGLFLMYVEMVKQTTLILLYGIRWLVTAGQMKMASASALILRNALTVLKGALIATGIGALAVGVGYLVTQFTLLTQSLGSFQAAVAVVKAVVVEQMALIREAFDLLPVAWAAAWEAIKSGVGVFLTAIIGMIFAFVNKAVDVFRAINAGVQAGWAALQVSWGGVMQALVRMAAMAAAEIARILGNVFDMVKGQFSVGNMVRDHVIPGSLLDKGFRGAGFNMDKREPETAGTGQAMYDKIMGMVPPDQKGASIGKAFIGGFVNAVKTQTPTDLGAKTMDKLGLQNATARTRARAMAGGVWDGIKKVWSKDQPALQSMVGRIKGAGAAAAGAVGPVTDLGAALDGLGGGGGGGGKGKKGGGGGGGEKSELQKLAEDQKKALAGLNAELEKYRATAGMTALEEEIWNAQKETGALKNQQLAATVRGIVVEIDALRQRKQDMAAMATTIESAFSSAFSSIASGAASARQVIADLLKSLAKMFADRAFQILWGGGSGGGGIGNAIIGALSGISFGKNANGTNNWTGGLTSVNERGGEIIDLPKGSRIYPNDISKRMAKSEKQEPVQVVVKLQPSAEFDTRVAETSQAVAVSVVSGYDKHAASSRVKQTIRNPRTKGR